VRIVRRIAGRRWGGVTFEGDFATWDDATAASTGYGERSILSRVTEATMKVLRGEAVYERDSVLFDQIQYSWPVLAALMWAAARSGSRLSVLDFGGALGGGYRQNRRFLDGLAEVKWGVVEQPHYVAQGRALLENEQLQFFDTIDECAVKLRPNVIVLGSVLQYVPDPDRVLHELERTPATVMIIDRTPFASIQQDRIIVQRVPPSIYEASYPCRVFSRERLRRALSSWSILETFACAEGAMSTDAGLSFTFEGFILHR
jgi:putative methyltransferase (TIGR04325 family)